MITRTLLPSRLVKSTGVAPGGVFALGSVGAIGEDLGELGRAQP